MKFLKILLVIIVIIIAVPLIIALFVKKDYALARSIVINKPTQQVYDYVKLLNNQDHFSKWNMLDPAKKTTNAGTDGTVGFVYAWDSEVSQAGKGEQEIKSLKDGKEVNMEVRFERPFKSVLQASFQTEPVADNQTKITWGINGHNPYPMNIMNLMMPSMLGNDIDTSLNNLKVLLEKQ